MAARRSSAGHSVKVSAETYALTILAAKEIGISIGDFADRALLASIKRQERWRQEQAYEAACRRAAEKREATPLRSDYVATLKKRPMSV